MNTAEYSNVSGTPQFPVIAGVEITIDSEGRFNLNALHKSSGLGAEKAPSKWMRNRFTQDMISLAEKKTGQICLVSTEGRSGGTFAHENLALEYAGWIKPEFRWEVNQTFIDHKTGNLSVPLIPQTLPDALRLAADLAEENQKVKHELEVAEPKVAFHDQVAVAPDAISLGQAAKTIGTGRNRLSSFLKQIGWVTRYGEPYQEKINRGYLDVKLGRWDHPDHGLQRSVTPLVTGKGLAKLQQLWSQGHTA